MTNFRSLMIFFIILGTIGIALNILFGANTMIYVNRSIILGTNLTWYKFDILAYKNQLEIAIKDTTILQLKTPTKRMWNIDITNWGDAIVHNLKVIVDYIIFIINIILYPFKIGGYALRFALSLLGLNYTSEASSVYWMGQLANGLVSVEIPFTTN